MILETVDKLFLELSQVTTATTYKELKMQRDIENALVFLKQAFYVLESVSDSDISHFESEEEEAEEYPVQYACRKIYQAISCISSGSSDSNTNTIETDDYVCHYEVNDDIKNKVFERVMAYFTKHEVFSGESLMQSDWTLLDAPTVLADIADDIIKFDAEWK